MIEKKKDPKGDSTTADKKASENIWSSFIHPNSDDFENRVQVTPHVFRNFTFHSRPLSLFVVDHIV
jgi:hypothetical protein